MEKLHYLNWGTGHYYSILKVEHLSPPQEYQGLSLGRTRTPIPECSRKTIHWLFPRKKKNIPCYRPDARNPSFALMKTLCATVYIHGLLFGLPLYNNSSESFIKTEHLLVIIRGNWGPSVNLSWSSNMSEHVWQLPEMPGASWEGAHSVGKETKRPRLTQKDSPVHWTRVINSENPLAKHVLDIKSSRTIWKNQDHYVEVLQEIWADSRA